MPHAIMKITVAALILPFFGAAHAAPRPSGNLRYNDAGRLIPAAVGQTVQVILPAYLGSRFIWQVRPGSRHKLAAPIEVIADPANPRLDVAVIRLLFTEPGRSDVEIVSTPVGAGGGAASDSLRYRFAVE